MISSATDESDEEDGREDTSIQESIRGGSITRLVLDIIARLWLGLLYAGTGKEEGPAI
jgi:hypothetical protein